MGRPDDFRSLCYVAVKSGHPALAAARGAERHISTGATLRIKCGAPHLMREIRTSGLMSGDGKRGGAHVSTRAHPRLCLHFDGISDSFRSLPESVPGRLATARSKYNAAFANLRPLLA